MESTEYIRDNNLPIMVGCIKGGEILVVFEGDPIPIGTRICWSGRVDGWNFNIYEEYKDENKT